MLAGEPPFTADNVGALTMAHVHQPVPPLPSTIPTAVATAIAAALSKDPADRPADAHAFATNLRRLQMASMPPPGKPDAGWRNAGSTPAADHTETMAATATMGAATSSRTAVMPAGRIVGAHGELGVFEQAHAGRHQRRWVGLFAIAIAALVAVIAVAQATNGGPDPVIGATTPQNSTTTVVTTVAPATTVVVNNPAPTPQTTVAKHGKKDEKKEKGGGKNG
jgi:serine/threonine-protein kinase